MDKKKLLIVFAKDGKHLLKTPSGEMIEGVVSTRVNDEINSLPYVICKIYVNIEDTPNED